MNAIEIFEGNIHAGPGDSTVEGVQDQSAVSAYPAITLIREKDIVECCAGVAFL